jgi:hypothetical protein
MTDRPTGYGWSVSATADGFAVTDVFTGDVVATTDTRVAAWTTVTTLSKGAS